MKKNIILMYFGMKLKHFEKQRQPHSQSGHDGNMIPPKNLKSITNHKLEKHKVCMIPPKKSNLFIYLQVLKGYLNNCHCSYYMYCK